MSDGSGNIMRHAIEIRTCPGSVPQEPRIPILQVSVGEIGYFCFFILRIDMGLIMAKNGFNGF